jgi:hypothetical protein
MYVIEFEFVFQMYAIKLCVCALNLMNEKGNSFSDLYTCKWNTCFADMQNSVDKLDVMMHKLINFAYCYIMMLS